jgi:hypothetical protein
MGFWSTLGKIALPAAGIAAAPFTGGGSLLTMLGMGAKTAGLIGAGAGMAGALAGGASRQRSEDRGAQADYDLYRSQLENRNALEAARERRSAESDRLRQLGSVDMLSSMQAPTDPRAVVSQGGRMSPEHLQMVRQRALAALESGSDVPAMTSLPDKPGGGPTGMDSLLNALSMGSTAVGAMRESGVLGGRPAPSGESVGSMNDLARLLPPGQDEPPPWSPLHPNQRRPEALFGQVNFPSNVRF